MSLAWFSIGSNIEKETNIRFAVRRLQQDFNDLQLSKVYLTRAIGFNGNDFYNLVGSFVTTKSIHALRNYFDALEDQTGRIKNTRQFEDRTLDIDLLLYDSVIFDDERITLPHPDVLNYDFILLPLSQMIPEYIHPVSGQSLAAHWAGRQPQPVYPQVALHFA